MMNSTFYEGSCQLAGSSETQRTVISPLLRHTSLEAGLLTTPLLTLITLVCTSIAMAEPKNDHVIFSDNFSGGLEHWTVEHWEEDKIEVTNKAGRMHVSTRETDNGVMIWLRKELPENYRFEFDVTPHSESGFFLIFFNTQHKDGKDILEEAVLNDKSAPTLFKKYTKSVINGYHISFRRNEVADCNLRKNSGMALLKKQILPHLLKKDETHHVSLTKHGGSIKLQVGENVFMNFKDDGQENGKVWSKGRIGFRQVYDSVGSYDNVKLTELKD
jgi:hypothetical protein